MDKPWKSYIISAQDDSYVISGGISQGLASGDRFFVYRKGKIVKNPQTGIDVEKQSCRFVVMREKPWILII